MESFAKTITQCDNCKANLAKQDGDKNEQIQATLVNGKQENQQYHYCSEECLRVHLNGRAKKKRSYASLGLLEIEFPITKK